MLIVNFSEREFEEFSERGARNTLRKTIVSDRDGSKMCRLRYYVIQPGGQTPYDIHDYEHIVIVVGGRGTLCLGSTEMVTHVSLTQSFSVIPMLKATPATRIGISCGRKTFTSISGSSTTGL